MTLSEFIARCDAYCEKAAVSRTWLSKRLFADTYWLENLAKGDAGISLKRFERAVDDLCRLERGEPVNRAGSPKRKRAQAEASA